MLGTIKMPMNMKLIHENLPSSNYESDKPKKPKQDAPPPIESKMAPIAEEEPEDRNVQKSALSSKARRVSGHRHPKVLKSLN